MSQQPKQKSPPKKRATRTRKALCQALLTLLEEKAFENITIREVTARAEVGYATFFRRYPDKETLLHDSAAQEIENLLHMTLPMLDLKDRKASNIATCNYVWEHRALWKALLAGGAAATLKEEYLSQALQLAESKSAPDAWLPGDLAVTFSVTALLEILAWWLKQSEPFPPEQIAMYIDQLALAPIFKS